MSLLKKFKPFNSLDPEGKAERQFRQENNTFATIGKKEESDAASGERVLSCVVRSKRLDKLDSYYERSQYNHLPDWKDTGMGKARESDKGLRDRKPKFNIAYAKTLSSRVTAKIAGQSVFPTVDIPENPNDQEFFRTVLRVSRLRAYLVEPIRRTINTGSCFVAFNIIGGRYAVKWYHSKYCYPTFDETDELEQVEIKYVYADENDRDVHGNPKKKWFRKIMHQYGEILYDNPPYDPDVKEPLFKEIENIPNDLGFVMGEWMTTSEDQGDTDGYGLIEDITEFIDELNYSLSQSARAVNYNQDPQLILKNIGSDVIDEIIRSVTKAWNLVGDKADATFLESDLAGVEKAIELREKITKNISEVTRAILLDPEKMVAVAQSARAMEVLNEPLVELVDEIRGLIEMHIQKLIVKMGIAAIYAKSLGMDSPIAMPENYFPVILNFALKWPQIFKETLEDIQKKVSLANQAASGNIISRKTATKYIADIFGIDDVDAELEEIASQPVMNPFGGF